MPFNLSEIPDLTGKVAVVTGANSGIGKVTALELARKGCHVILACRSEEKTKDVVEEIQKETNNEKVEFMKLDLSSLDSVLTFVEAYREKNLPLNILVNNAGVMFGRFELTKDNVEKQFQTNHLGHFLLTVSLFDILEKSQPSRVVSLSSMAHNMTYSTGILPDVNDPKPYSETSAYGQSKLCNLLFAKKLASKVEDKNIFVNAVHPGYVQTDLQQTIYQQWNGFLGWISQLAVKLFGLNVVQGSLTSLYVATSPEIETNNIRGKYFVPIAKQANPSAFGQNAELATKLWDLSESMLKERLGDRYQPKI